MAPKVLILKLPKRSMREPQFWEPSWKIVDGKSIMIKIPITARRQAEIEAWADDQWGHM